MDIEIRQEKRGSLAFQLTPQGGVVLVPEHLDPQSDKVQRFITEAVEKLPKVEPIAEPHDPDDIYALVSQWAERLKVEVTRIQIRAMTNKWGSISTAGTLTLADDLLHVPIELVEYVVVHELLHLKFPDHRKGWRVSMGMHIPDWQDRELKLMLFQKYPHYL